MNKVLSWFCKIFLAPLFSLLFLKKVEGKENIPHSNFILVSNHLSYLDILVDGYICLPRSFCFIGQIDGFKGILKKLVLLAYFFTGTIPLDRKSQASKKNCFQKSIEVLKKGNILVLYPEGTRSKNGKLQEFKNGFAKIFLKTGFPILPVVLKGTYELLPPHGKLKIKKIIEAKILPPLYFKEEFEKAKKFSEESEDYQKIVKEITQKTWEEMAKVLKS